MSSRLTNAAAPQAPADTNRVSCTTVSEALFHIPMEKAKPKFARTNPKNNRSFQQFVSVIRPTMNKIQIRCVATSQGS